MVKWKNGKMEKWKNDLIKKAEAIKFPIHEKYSALSEKEKKFLWNETIKFKGIYAFFDFLKKKSYKVQYRVMLSKYKSLSICKQCNGNRLKKESEYIKINDKNIQSVVNYQIQGSNFSFSDSFSASGSPSDHSHDIGNHSHSFSDSSISVSSSGSLDLRVQYVDVIICSKD